MQYVAYFEYKKLILKKELNMEKKLQYLIVLRVMENLYQQDTN